MKIDGKLLIALLIALVLSALELLFIWLFSLIGWGLVYVVFFVFAIIPVHNLITLWIKHDCMDLGDLWDVILSPEEEKDNTKTEESKIMNSYNNNYYDGFS